MRHASSSARRATAAPISSGWSLDPGGSMSGTPAARASTAHHDAPAQAARDVGTTCEGRRAQDDDLPPWQAAEGAEDGAEPREVLGPPLDDEARPGRSRLEQGTVDPEGQHPVVAREPGRRSVRGGPAGCRQRVDAAEELLALLLARRVAEPLGRVERRHGQTACVAERQVGEAGDAGLVHVDEVEAVAGECQVEVRPHADGNPEAAPAGDRDRRAERDRPRERRSLPAQPLEGAASGGQFRRPP